MKKDQEQERKTMEKRSANESVGTAGKNTRPPYVTGKPWLSGLTLVDSVNPGRSIVMSALHRETDVIHVYQSDSSSKKPTPFAPQSFANEMRKT